MKKEKLFRRSTVGLVVAALALSPTVYGAPLALSQAPPGTASKAPAPNVIVSVDDSGSMGEEGMEALRNSLLNTFTAANVPDGSIRLAWQAMSGCYEIPSPGGFCQNQNAMKVLDSTHRQTFNEWVARLTYVDGTPSHRMYFNAGEYLRRQDLGVHSPWASVPGTTEEPVLSCRKSFNVFMTDGGWNQYTENMAPLVGNADGTSRTLPDSTAYDTASNDTLPYRDTFGSTVLPTLSDLAFYYWATDLQPTIANDVPKRMVRATDETFTSDGVTRAVSPYWNPRNDPATWQHMVTYTVGFNAAANWNFVATPRFGTDTWNGGDYPALMTGTTTWGDAIAGTRLPELWHMALNGRGKFVPAPNADALTTAFKDILNSINADQSAQTTSLAGSSLTTRNDSVAYSAGYSGSAWTGYVAANTVTAGTGAFSTTSPWGTVPGSAPPKNVTTATLLDATTFSPSTRLVLSHNGTTGIVWNWGNLTTAQQAAMNTLNGAVTTLGEDRLNYIRGDRTKEVSAGGPFRNRESRQGDIVNSKVWFLGGKPNAGYTDSTYASFRSSKAARPSMLYVGGNDGMLHAFGASDGVEKLAYVPRGLHATLPELSSTSYSHRYYVDGSPFSGDVKIGTDWKTYLAGFLGAGGRGYFALDVTDPANFPTSNAQNLVVLDNTDPATLDDDVGYITSEPVMDQSNLTFTQQITKLNDGRWALVMGNGYNSPNEQAVLLVQYLDGAKELLKIAAGTAGGNGLSAPRLVDLNGDKIPDIAYAGDLKGNLWKFDLSSPAQATTPNSWKVAFNGLPLYVAADSTPKLQPITSAPVWLPHPNGGVMVIFGTGRNLTDADRSDTSRQSIYGIYDNTAVERSATNTVTLTGGTAITDGRLSLVGQSVGTTLAGTATDSGAKLWNLSSNAVDYTGTSAKRGWYLDLPESGERVLSNAQWFDGQLVDITSTVPAIGSNPLEETCTPSLASGRNYLNTMNAITGAAPKSQIYSYTAATVIVGDPKNASRIETALRYGVKSQTQEKSVCSGGGCTPRTLLSKTSLRPSWYQLQ